MKSFDDRFDEWEGHFEHYRAVLKKRHKTLKPHKIYSRIEKFWTWLQDNRILPSDLKKTHFARYANDLRSGTLCVETERYSDASLIIFLSHALAWCRHLYQADIFLQNPFDDCPLNAVYKDEKPYSGDFSFAFRAGELRFNVSAVFQQLPNDDGNVLALVRP